MKRILYYGVLIVLLSVVGYSGWMIWQISSEYNDAAAQYDRLSQYISIPEPGAPVPTEATESTTGTVPPEDDTVWPVVDFEALWEINSDVVAWICIEGTSVNYPIVQGDDNSFYLRRLLDGTRNSGGTIFLDSGCEGDFSGRNSIIYGHNMKNGSMFHPLMEYKHQNFYQEHVEVLLLTPHRNYKILLFSGYVANVNDSAWDLDFTEESYKQWLSQISQKSCFDSEVQPTVTDHIVTLSTCSYEFDNARFVLHGILK